ncbi:unnamed protein product [Sphenostylis stenocarpa]|uniref:Uncharacterized protein n=1 Tax=Sphenostylis stenocarpa TaxID=92480 RepID=A0AA86VW89_9FABA|nr:unnamed protein product [Sphenostylis stenocarpa]
MVLVLDTWEEDKIGIVGHSFKALQSMEIGNLTQRGLNETLYPAHPPSGEHVGIELEKLTSKRQR